MKKKSAKKQDLGDAWLEQKGPFYVGTCYQFDVTYKAGARGIREGGGFCVTIPGTIGWGVPQVEISQEEMGYCTVWSSNPDVTLAVRIKGFVMPPGSGKEQDRIVQAMLIKGDLSPEDTITLRIGDTRRGWGRGLMVGIVASQPKGHIEYFEVGVDLKGSDKFQPLIDLPIQVAPREAESFEIIGPSIAGAGERIDFSLKAEDLYCNPAINYQGEPLITGNGMHSLPSRVKFSQRDKGVKLLRGARCTSPGIVRIRVKDESQRLEAKSNPIRVEEDPKGRLLWGELHCHSALSVDNKRNGLRVRPAEMYEIGRDVNRLDFMWITDHHVPWATSAALTEEEWEETVQAAKNATRSKAFLAFVGDEYSGRERRGHTNILFRDIDMPRPGKELVDLEHVWRHYRRTGHEFMTIPHLHTLLGSRLEDGRWPYRNPQRERLIEIFSCHGRYEYFNNRPWLKAPRPPDHLRTVQDILAMGLRYGIVGGSDGHKGHPGQQSMTAVYVKNFSRKALWDGLMARRCYATTHARILLDFTLNGHPMGSELSFPMESLRDSKLPRSIKVTAAGTEPILKLDIVRNGRDCFTLYPKKEVMEFEWQDNEAPQLHVLRPNGDCFVYYYIRVYQADGEMAWSSPIWLNFGA